MPRTRTRTVTPDTVDVAVAQLELLNKLLSAYASERPSVTLTNDELLTFSEMLDEIVANLKAGNAAASQEHEALYMQVMRHERPELARLIKDTDLAPRPRGPQ